MNNEQQELLDEAYENYCKEYENGTHRIGTGLLWMAKETKDTFVYRSKTDSEFSEKWGLTIEERELSLEERATIWNNTHNPAGNIFTHNQYDENNIPKRAISLRYNHKTITNYEH
jgi:hypothetical protein